MASLTGGTQAFAIQTLNSSATQQHALGAVQVVVVDEVGEAAEVLEGMYRHIAAQSGAQNAQEWSGRTVCNRIVNFAGGPQGERLLGQMLDVRITEAYPHSLRGEVVMREG